MDENSQLSGIKDNLPQRRYLLAGGVVIGGLLVLLGLLMIPTIIAQSTPVASNGFGGHDSPIQYHIMDYQIVNSSGDLVMNEDKTLTSTFTIQNSKTGEFEGGLEGGGVQHLGYSHQVKTYFNSDTTEMYTQGGFMRNKSGGFATTYSEYVDYDATGITTHYERSVTWGQTDDGEVKKEDQSDTILDNNECLSPDETAVYTVDRQNLSDSMTYDDAERHRLRTPSQAYVKTLNTISQLTVNESNDTITIRMQEGLYKPYNEGVLIHVIDTEGRIIAEKQDVNVTVVDEHTGETETWETGTKYFVTDANVTADVRLVKYASIGEGGSGIVVPTQQNMGVIHTLQYTESITHGNTTVNEPGWTSETEQCEQSP